MKEAAKDQGMTVVAQTTWQMKEVTGRKATLSVWKWGGDGVD
jgi:hypothetical protein